MNKFSKQKKVLIFRLSDGKKKLVNSVEEAVEITGCTRDYIRLSATNEKHYSNLSDNWQPLTSRGKVRTKTVKPLYRFEYVNDPIIRAYPMFAHTVSNYEFTSHYAAIKQLNCSQSTYFDHLKRLIPYIIDKEKRLWKIDWLEQEETVHA